MSVIGIVELTGLTDANTLNLVAGDALEVILGQGSVRLVNGADPAGQLNMLSDDIIVATAEAIADGGPATSTAATHTPPENNTGTTPYTIPPSPTGHPTTAAPGFPSPHP